MKIRFLVICLSLASVNYAAQKQEAGAQKGAGETIDERLISCVKIGDPACVTGALAVGAKANAVNKEGRTALILAAEGKSAKVVRVLLDAGADVNGAREGEGTPLCRAALFGRKEIAEMLLARKAKINVVCDSDHGDTPLMEALRGTMFSDMSVELREGLTQEIGSGDSVEDDDDASRAGKADKLREVMHAPRDNFLAIARSLLARGADVNVVAKCDAGETALMYAAMGASPEMVKELLSHGANVEQGASVLALLMEFEREHEQGKRLPTLLPALSKEQRGLLDWNEKTTAAREEIKRLLKAAGAKEAVSEDGHENIEANAKTLEETAVEAFGDLIQKGDMRDFARLVEAYAVHPLGARVLPEALRIAVIYSRIEMVKLLLERGVDPNPHSERGRGHTPLMHAAHDGKLEYVRLLLEAGADVHVKNDDGCTALDAAEGWARDEHLAIVELLKARGAKSKGQEP
jgi:ankyrin repeat protein